MAWYNPPEGLITSHFSWSEAACRHCGKIPDEQTVRETARWLEDVRKALGDRILHVVGWCRCPEHNAALGGAEDSLHLTGLAVDVNPRGLSPRETFVLLVEHQGKHRLIGGLGGNPGYTHVDRGEPQRWEEAPEQTLGDPDQEGDIARGEPSR